VSRRLCRCEQRRLLDPIEGFGRGDPAEHPPGAVVEFGRDSVEARMYASARVQKIYGGTNEIMKELIGRTL
jgi:alkylation response protein AidB-like acyl-CoA dehydrogenase